MRSFRSLIVLQFNTFFEYFDLMLYVHLAVMLDELFFPKTSPEVARLIRAASFCTPFLFRPLGAIIFGFIGDTWGRKITVIVTTLLMSISCLCIANLKTYVEIGILASLSLTLCRALQGISSMGEMIGAQVYLTELYKPPKNYRAVTLLECADCIGALMALVIANVILKFHYNWRIIFFVGALIAILSLISRIYLTEGLEFKRAVKKQAIVNIDKKALILYFFMFCASPACFYFIFVYCGEILKSNFNYTAQQVLYHNLLVSIIDCFGAIAMAYLCGKIYPLKLVKFKAAIFSIVMLLAPYFLTEMLSVFNIFLIQIICSLCWLNIMPATAIFFKHFPTLKRFTCASMVHALSRALMYIVIAFGLVFLTNRFGHYGLIILFTPLIVAFWAGIIYCEYVELYLKKVKLQET